MGHLLNIDSRKAKDTSTVLGTVTRPELLTQGVYRARLVQSPADLTVALSLRARTFRTDASDKDDFDDACVHMLVEHVATAQPVCCYRLLLLEGGYQLPQSYSAQFYDLRRLEQFPGRMVELGRFCLNPNYRDPDILRLAWGALTAFVDQNQVQMLFGCTSFAGTSTSQYMDAFAQLKARHLAPHCWTPDVKAPEVFRYAARLRRKPDAKKAMRCMPSLLKTYLMMGGWVSDHAVVDHQMDTLHVFTGVEICAIPDARKRVLRGIAG